MSELSDALLRMWADLTAKPSGPHAFRFLLPPVIGSAFAVRDGMKDGRCGAPPSLSALCWSRHNGEPGSSSASRPDRS